MPQRAEPPDSELEGQLNTGVGSLGKKDKHQQNQEILAHYKPGKRKGEKETPKSHAPKGRLKPKKWDG